MYHIQREGRTTKRTNWTAEVRKGWEFSAYWRNRYSHRVDKKYDKWQRNSQRPAEGRYHERIRHNKRDVKSDKSRSLEDKQCKKINPETKARVQEAISI